MSCSIRTVQNILPPQGVLSPMDTRRKRFSRSAGHGSNHDDERFYPHGLIALRVGHDRDGSYCKLDKNHANMMHTLPKRKGKTSKIFSPLVSRKSGTRFPIFMLSSCIPCSEAKKETQSTFAPWISPVFLCKEMDDSRTVGTSFILEQRIKLFHKGIDILELPVNRSKTHIGNLIHCAQLLHDEFTDHLAGYLALK